MTGTFIPKHLIDGDLRPSTAELRSKFPRCSRLQDFDLEFIFVMMEAIKNLMATTPMEGRGRNMAAMIRAILAGTAPGVEAIVNANLPGTGAFTFRAGGNLLDLLVVRSKEDGPMECLGDTSTILSLGGPFGLRQDWDNYLPALQTIRAIVDGGGVFLCDLSGNLQGLPADGGSPEGEVVR